MITSLVPGDMSRLFLFRDDGYYHGFDDPLWLAEGITKYGVGNGVSVII